MSGLDLAAMMMAAFAFTNWDADEFLGRWLLVFISRRVIAEYSLTDVSRAKASVDVFVSSYSLSMSLYLVIRCQCLCI
jgi:hypothetical protein